jgi:excinuclease UvrABC nuclease subunit
MMGQKKNMLYVLPSDYEIPSTSGIYCFYRKHGNCVCAVYIGKADNLEQRIKQQFNNVKLMMAKKNLEVVKRN